MGVQFNEDTYTTRANSSKTKGIAGWLISRGIAKNVSQANLIMFVTIVISLIIIYIVNFSESFSTESDIDTLDPALNPALTI